MSREMVYRVRIDTSQAKSSAQQIRQAIEAELRTIQVGQLNLSSLTAATNEAQRFRAELEQAAQVASGIQVNPSAVPSGGRVGTGVRSGGDGQDLTGVLDQIPVVGQLGSALAGGFAVGAVVAGIREIGSALDELARRGAVFGQVSDVLDDYAASVGTTSRAIVSAAKEAAAGTISEFDLILNANRAIQFQVAQTPEQFAKLIELSTALGRAQGITDTDALDYIVRGIARQSSLILDNLGLFIDLEEVQAEYAASLGKTTDELTAAEKNQAVLNEAFRQGQTAIQANRDASESAATQFEKLDANIQNLKDTFGAWLAEVSASKIGAIADAIGRVNAELSGERDSPEGIQQDIDSLVAMRDKLKRGQDVSAMGVVIPGDADAVDFYTKKIEEATAAKWRAIAASRDLNETNQQAAYLSMQAANALTIESENARRAAELKKAAALENLTDGQSSINKGIDSAAQKSVGDLGLEQTIAILKEQKRIADEAIQELALSAVTDPDTIALRIAEIQQAATDAFAQAVAEQPEIDPGVTAASFDVINEALANLNQGFIDFLPNTAAVRDELIDLSAEVQYTGVVTAEQAAQLDYLSAAAAAASGEAGFLTAVTNELGAAFLAENEGAAAVVDQMYQATAAYMNGSVTAEQYAGVMAALGGQLLAYAQQAGVATSATLALISAQGGLAGTAGFAQGQTTGAAINSRIRAQQDARARDEARKAAQRAAKEAEAAAKRAAREQESAAKRAGKELERAAKKAADELKAALKSVPGLFGRSPVTKEQIDLAKQGVPQNFADDYLRRLEDEVFNKKDWADVSIEEAKAALARIGITASDNNKAAFEQFAQAWDTSALFADKENLKFINQEAVKLQLDLQEKAKEGQKNIYELFGIAVDEAVDSVADGIGGGGGGGGGISSGVADLQIPITATLEPIPPITETPTVPVQPYILPTAWKQIEMPPLSMPIQSQITGTQVNTGATAGLFDVATIQSQLDTLKFPQFDATAMGLADLQAQINGLTTTVAVTATLAPDAGATIASDLADQLSAQVATFKSQGGTIGDVIKAGFSESFNAIEGDKVVTTTLADSIIASIGVQLGAKVKTLEGVGAGIGPIIRTGIANDMNTVQWEDGEIVAPIADGLVTAINTQVRGTTADFKREGTSIAQLVMAGLSSGLEGVNAEGTQSTDLAFALVGALNSQFSTNANFFYAAGQPVATDVMSGYKSMFGSNNEGAPLVTPIITAINTQIRMQGESLQNQGITMAQYVQNGFTTAFNGEAFKSSIIAAGETMGAYLEIGILSRIRGGALVEAIGAQVLADITAEVEAP